MTRETKIGLLLGMGVILLIGIIVSDHLSGVQEAADLTGFAVEAQRTIESSDVIPGRRVAKPAEAVPVIKAPNHFYTPKRTNDTTAFQTQQAKAAPEAVVTTLTLGSTLAPLPHTINRTITAPQPTTGPGIHHTVLAGETLFKIAERHYGNGEYWRAIAQANPRKVTRDGRVSKGVVLDIPKRNESRLSSAFIPAIPQKKIWNNTYTPSNTSRIIEVVSGDTLSELAAKHLGSAARWPDLLKANRDKLDDPQSLSIGMKLRLPGSSDRPQAFTPTSGRNTASRPATGGTYTVRSGDNLTLIAEKKLGDGNRWPEVYEANKKTLKSPDSLVVGQKLIIPR